MNKLKYFLTIILLFIPLSLIEVCHAQFIPHKAYITPLKDSVLSTEIFIVTYSLTDVEGHVYIGIPDGYFKVIGNDRWEGFIKLGETVSVPFTVRLKEKIKPYLTRDKAFLSIGFSYKPFGETINKGEFETILITLSDFKDFSQKRQNIHNDSTKISNSGSQNLDLHLLPYDTDVQLLRKNIVLDTSDKKSETLEDSNYFPIIAKKNITRKVTNNGGQINGRVIDEISGKRIINAGIIIEGTPKIAYTDSLGNFTLQNILPGIYYIRTFKLGFHQAKILNVLVKSGQTSIVNIQLVNEGIPEKPLSYNWEHAFIKN